MSLEGLQRVRIAGATDVIVIGAGHAGLSISYLLSEQGVDNVVLERGEVANSWRNERWNSLKLLTPNWQTRLPGHYYSGDDPDGFMGMSELVDFFDDYAATLEAPLYTNTTVTSLFRDGTTYRVTTNRGTWRAKSVVIATGACNKPSVPKVAASIPAGVTQLTALDYRSPRQLEVGGVLIVGASATGMQLADEILRSGRDVTMAVGEHVRMPRRYRGKDILYWLDRSGIHGQRYDEVEDINRGRKLPSPQLVGSNDKAILDLNSLSDQGARIVGRLMGVRDGVAQFSGSLRNVCALADLKMKRLLNAIDEACPVAAADAAPERFDDTHVDTFPRLTLSFDTANIRTVIWATGFRPDYSWLNVPVLDRKGCIQHDGGIVDVPGMYVLGLPLMRRRKSSFIYGIEDDARDISEHLIQYLDTTRSLNDGIYQYDTGARGHRRSA